MSAFIVFGIDVLNGPNVSTNSSAGTGGQGTATITGGTQPFEDDDVIVFGTVRLTSEGEIGPGCAISDVTAYDSLADFQAGLVKLDYRPQNPGQTAKVQNDVSGLGDGYVRFNANVLVPENGGPSFSQLFVAPGTNLADAAAAPGGLTLNRFQDFDFNGDGDADDPPVEPANGRFFVAGTAIATPSGPVAVEDLAAGDRVSTRDNGAQFVTRVGQRRVPDLGAMAPVVLPQRPSGQSVTYGCHKTKGCCAMGPIWPFCLTQARCSWTPNTLPGRLACAASPEGA